MTVTELPRQSRPATPQMSEVALLSELEQVVEANLNRHFSVAKEWFPHEYVPWSEGENFDGVLGGTAWSPEQSKLPEIIEDGETGFVCGPDDVEGMAARGVALLTDASVRSRITQAAVGRVRTQYCEGVIVPQYEAYYSEVLAREINARSKISD